MYRVFGLSSKLDKGAKYDKLPGTHVVALGHEIWKNQHIIEYFTKHGALKHPDPSNRGA